MKPGLTRQLSWFLRCLPYLFSAAAVMLVGGVFFLVYAVAILDPVGTKLSDDENPFGEPPSRIVSALLAVATVVVTGGVTWLILRVAPDDDESLPPGD